MQDRTTNTRTTCSPQRALFSLLNNYSKEDVDYCFKDIKKELKINRATLA
jgi:hypothetical protein